MRRWWLGVAVFAVAGVTPTTSPAGAASGSVDMIGSGYVPRTVVVAPGDTVTWTNRDTVGHSVTADDGSFDSSPQCGTGTGACLAAGQTYQRAFPGPGQFPYYCRVHGAPGGQGMAGTVVVQ